MKCYDHRAKAHDEACGLEPADHLAYAKTFAAALEESSPAKSSQMCEVMENMVLKNAIARRCIMAHYTRLVFERATDRILGDILDVIDKEDGA